MWIQLFPIQLTGTLLVSMVKSFVCPDNPTKQCQLIAASIIPRDIELSGQHGRTQPSIVSAFLVMLELSPEESPPPVSPSAFPTPNTVRRICIIFQNPGGHSNCNGAPDRGWKNRSWWAHRHSDGPPWPSPPLP